MGFIFPSFAEDEGACIVVTQEDIAKFNAIGIQDVLNQIPGVKATSTFVSLWGSTKVRVLLDGRPINDPTSGHGKVKWGLVSLSSVEKIEICKGKGGVEFGDDSSGGVILITTRKVSTFYGYTEAFLGSWNKRYVETSLEKNLGKVMCGLSGSYYTTDGYRENGDREKWRIGLGITNRAYFLAIKKEHKDPDRNLYTKISVNTLEEEITKGFNFERLGKIKVGVGGGLSWAAGSYFVSQEEGKCWGFVTKEFGLRRFPISGLLGVRANYYSTFGGIINPEVRLQYEKRAFEINLAISRTNNVPTFLQGYGKTSTTLPNPDLTIETALNRSLTFLWKQKKSINFSFSLFYNTISDRITYVRGDDGIGRYENLGNVIYRGADISLNVKPRGPFSFDASYTYLHARDEETGCWLPGQPWHRLKGNLRFRRKNFSANLYGRFVSRQYTRADNRESVPSYVRVDLGAEYRLKKLRIFGKVENVFDERYYYGDGYPASPRSWTFGISSQF